MRKWENIDEKLKTDALEAESLGRFSLTNAFSRLHVQLRRNVTMSRAFSCVQAALIDFIWHYYGQNVHNKNSVCYLQ